MKGLLKTAKQQPQEPEAQAPKQGSKGTQEEYDMAAGQMLKWLASDEGYSAAVQSMQADPEQGMAKLIGQLLQMTNQSAYMAGKSLSPNVLFQAGMEITKAIATVGLKEGLLSKESEAELAEDAFFDGLAMFAQESQEEALTEQSRAQFVKLIDGVEAIKNKRGAAA